MSYKRIHPLYCFVIKIKMCKIKYILIINNNSYNYHMKCLFIFPCENSTKIMKGYFLHWGC